MNHNYPEIWERVVAKLIDGVILSPLLIIQYVVGKMTHHTGLNAVVSLLISTIFLIYPIWMVAAYKGQTFGKKFMKQRVVHLDVRAKVPLYKSVLRELIPCIVWIIGLVLFIQHVVVSPSQNPKVFFDMESMSSSYLGYWALIDFLCLVLSVKRRALHDYLASTVVVNC